MFTVSKLLWTGGAKRLALGAALIALITVAIACGGRPESARVDTGGAEAASAAQEAAKSAEAAAMAAQEAASAAMQASEAAQMANGASPAAGDTAAAVDAAQEAASAASMASTAAEAASMAAQEASAAVQKVSEGASSAVMNGSEAVSAAQEAAKSAETAAMAAQEASAAARAASDANSDVGDDAAEAVAAAQKAAEAAGMAATAAEAASMAAREASAAAQNMAESAAMTADSSMIMDGDRGTLVLYSGRSESLVAPVIEQFENATGIDVEVKYGGTSAVAATIQEEGANSPADVFWAQDPGALAALADRFTPLPSDVTLAVPEWARASDGRWVGVTGRARVIVYNTDLDESELPASVEELADPKWKGRIGWPPANASFRVMVTAMRHTWGEDKTREWLEGMIANDVGAYPKNTPIVAAAGAGEVDVGLVNHYYLHRFIAEYGDDFGARNLFLNDGGPGSLVMIAGAGILDTADNPENAEAFVRFLLSKVAQQYFAASIYEYPLIQGVKTHRLLPPLESLNGPDINFALLDDLEGTEALLREVGAIP